MYIDTKDNNSAGRIVLNAEKADKLSSSKKITLSGNLQSSFNFDGSSDVTVPVTVIGAKMTDHLWLTGADANSSTASSSQIIFGTEDDNHVVISSNNDALVINPTASTTTNQIVLYLNQPSVFPNGIQTNVYGNASTATKATQDGNGNVITSKYVTLDTVQTINSTKTMTRGLNVSGRSAGGGNDEGIVIGFADNGYAGLCLGGAASARSVFYFKSDGTLPFWRYNNGTASYDIHHPSKNGTIALTNDLANYLPLSGGTMSGLLNAHGGISLNASTAQAAGAPEYILGIKAFAEGGNVIWQSRANVSVGYADSAGTANSAKLLHLNHGTKSATAYTSMSSWNGAVSGMKYVWGQSFFDSSIGTDSGDLVFGLRAGEYSSGGTELCIMLDGDYYSMGNKVLHAGNYTNYAATKNHNHNSTYVKKSGDTMSGALNFANGTWNNVGDDCALGDYNHAGVIGIKGLNGATGIYFVPYSGSTAQKITIDGAGTMSITGKISADTLQTIQNGVISTIGSQNSGWLHYSTNSPSGHWFNTNVSVQGNIYAGTNYNDLVLTSANYTSYAPTKTGNGASGTWGINITGTSNTSGYLNINNTANLSGGLQYVQASAQTSGNDLPTNTWWHVIKMNHGQGDTYYKRLLAFDFWNDNIMTSGAAGDGKVRTWKQVWVQGNSVTGAVWNDYAECRESDCEDFGYVLMEVGDDSLTKTTERLSHFAGVSSDTWGFSQGETNKAKTPIAVAGRVLVYTYQDRNNYKPGDCVCAAPGGTVDIMTREEIINWPDRIVGTVSCVPNYEEWGGGESADRPAVKVNGRIWIKVR